VQSATQKFRNSKPAQKVAATLGMAAINGVLRETTGISLGNGLVKLVDVVDISDKRTAGNTATSPGVQSNPSPNHSGPGCRPTPAQNTVLMGTGMKVAASLLRSAMRGDNDTEDYDFSAGDASQEADFTDCGDAGFSADTTCDDFNQDYEQQEDTNQVYVQEGEIQYGYSGDDTTGLYDGSGYSAVDSDTAGVIDQNIYTDSTQYGTANDIEYGGTGMNIQESSTAGYGLVAQSEVVIGSDNSYEYGAITEQQVQYVAPTSQGDVPVSDFAQSSYSYQNIEPSNEIITDTSQVSEATFTVTENISGPAVVGEYWTVNVKEQPAIVSEYHSITSASMAGPMTDFYDSSAFEPSAVIDGNVDEIAEGNDGIPNEYSMLPPSDGDSAQQDANTNDSGSLAEPGTAGMNTGVQDAAILDPLSGQTEEVGQAGKGAQLNNAPHMGQELAPLDSLVPEPLNIPSQSGQTDPISPMPMYTDPMIPNDPVLSDPVMPSQTSPPAPVDPVVLQPQAPPPTVVDPVMPPPQASPPTTDNTIMAPPHAAPPLMGNSSMPPPHASPPVMSHSATSHSTTSHPITSHPATSPLVMSHAVKPHPTMSRLDAKQRASDIQAQGSANALSLI
jgi:hypothetical protein